MKYFIIPFLFLSLFFQLNARKINDSTAPLHLIKPDYSKIDEKDDNENPSSARNFDFGSGPVKEGFEQITEKSIYTNSKGFGLIPSGEIVSGKNSAKDPLTGDYIGSNKPFYFVVNLPEGHY